MLYNKFFYEKKTVWIFVLVPSRADNDVQCCYKGGLTYGVARWTLCSAAFCFLFWWTQWAVVTYYRKRSDLKTNPVNAIVMHDIIIYKKNKKHNKHKNVWFRHPTDPKNYLVYTVGWTEYPFSISYNIN